LTLIKQGIHSFVLRGTFMSSAKIISERWIDSEVVEVLVSPAIVAAFGVDAAKEMTEGDTEQITEDHEESNE